eukprot:c46091_g1_i1.p1 GENE.c46091_g1_i1~~c46091_g1_i1.p1  ORF type:complete len:228 (-),score=45.24 c46091_g1_i1:45-695(-)
MKVTVALLLLALAIGTIAFEITPNFPAPEGDAPTTPTAPQESNELTIMPVPESHPHGHGGHRHGPRRVIVVVDRMRVVQMIEGGDNDERRERHHGDHEHGRRGHGHGRVGNAEENKDQILDVTTCKTLLTADERVACLIEVIESYQAHRRTHRHGCRMFVPLLVMAGVFVVAVAIKRRRCRRAAAEAAAAAAAATSTASQTDACAAPAYTAVPSKV